GLQHRYSPSVFLSYMVTMQYSTPFLKSIYRREQLLRLYNLIRLLFQTVLTINKTYCSTFSTHYNRFSTCCLPFKLYSFYELSIRYSCCSKDCIISRNKVCHFKYFIHIV